MKLPRDLGGLDLAKALGRYDYEITRQTGSHLRLTTRRGGEHHLTIPSHRALRVGTINGILNELAQHLKRDKAELVREIFG